MTVPAYDSWTNKDLVTFNSLDAQSDYQIAIRIPANSFIFSQAQTNGEDLRFGSGVTPLSYWVKDWGSISKPALVYVKVPNISVGVNAIDIYTGKASASSESNGSNVFEYFNALATQADLDDLASSFGAASWAVVADVSAPNGFAVEGGDAVSGADSGRYKALTLPENHVIEITTANITGDSWQGPLVNMADTNSWSRPGTRTTLTNSAQIRENDNGVFTNHATTLVDGSQVIQNNYYEQTSRYQPKTIINELSSFSLTASTGVVQGVATDTVKIFTTGNTDKIARWSLTGTLEEDVTFTPADGSSWGDCEIKDGLLHVIRFGSTTTTKVYTFDPYDLASGGTLVADISADMDTGANSLVWAGTHWVVGETDATSVNLHAYIFNEAWVLQKSLVIQRVLNDGFGWQGGTFVDNYIYLLDHTTGMGKFLFNPDTLTLDMVDCADDFPNTSQSMAWDSANNRFYIVDRIDDEVKFITLEQHATTKAIWTNWSGGDRSVACPIFDAVTADQNTQSQVGIGTFRKSRTAQLFIRKSGNDPLALVTAGAPPTPTTGVGIIKPMISPIISSVIK